MAPLPLRNTRIGLQFNSYNMILSSELCQEPRRQDGAMSKRLSATMEDYLGVILRFQQQKRFARVSDVAAVLGVAKSAVTAALQSLSAKGLVNYTPYEPVTLTGEGQERAEEMALRHRIILDFLRDVLAMNPEEAAVIADEMEHVIDARALDRFVCFLAFVRTRSGKGGTWIQEFERFMQRGAQGRSCKECIRAYLAQMNEEVVANASPGA
jgi:DtxR family Mn-dependent transcriptional regulator